MDKRNGEYVGTSNNRLEVQIGQCEGQVTPVVDADTGADEVAAAVDRAANNGHLQRRIAISGA